MLSEKLNDSVLYSDAFKRIAGANVMNDSPKIKQSDKPVQPVNVEWADKLFQLHEAWRIV
jgi:hypothetical protein